MTDLPLPGDRLPSPPLEPAARERLVDDASSVVPITGRATSGFTECFVGRAGPALPPPDAAR